VVTVNFMDEARAQALDLVVAWGTAATAVASGLAAVGTIAAVACALVVAGREARWRRADQEGRALAVALAAHIGVQEWARRARGVWEHLGNEHRSTIPETLSLNTSVNPLLVPAEAEDVLGRLSDLGPAATPLVRAVLAAQAARQLRHAWEGREDEERRPYSNVEAAQRFEFLLGELKRETQDALDRLQVILGVKGSALVR